MKRILIYRIVKPKIGIRKIFEFCVRQIWRGQEKCFAQKIVI